jgi:hypothetical protein
LLRFFLSTQGSVGMENTVARDHASPARGVYINIQNSTATSLYVSTAFLTGGEWEPGATPAIGQTIGAGSNPVFENGGSTVYTQLGGSMTLAPLTGGQITITWGWPTDYPLLASCNNTSSLITINYWTINTSSNFPTLMVVITPVSLAAA